MLPVYRSFPHIPYFTKTAHYNLKWFSSPNIVWALVPAVAAYLKNTVSAFKPIKKPRLTHNPSTVRIYHEVTLLVW
jgi:hypothetical protein